MNKTPQTPPQRNWVAKHNFNRPVRHRAQTDYQRHTKHRQRDLDQHSI